MKFSTLVKIEKWGNRVAIGFALAAAICNAIAKNYSALMGWLAAAIWAWNTDCAQRDGDDWRRRYLRDVLGIKEEDEQ